MGKGVWIWKLAECQGGDVGEIVAKAVRAGLTRVFVKIADGCTAYNDTAQLKRLAAELKQAGIHAWGWGWTYAGSVEKATAEANFAGHRMLGLGLRGYVIDAEAEYEAAGSARWATAFCRRIRQIIHQAPLGVTSYWSPQYHPRVPWAAFAAEIDYWWPQVYWYNRAPRAVLRASLAELAKYGREVIPLGAADPGDGCGNAGELREFMSEVDGTPALNHGADFYQWSAIPGANWTVIRDWQPKT